MLEGYNVAFRINGKTVVGRTSDDLTIAARTVDSITKDDQGESQESVTGHDVTFSAAGMMAVGNSETGKLDRDDMMEQALKKGSAAVIPVTYAAAGGDTYQGNSIMTQYRESTNATDIGTWSADFKIQGEFAKVNTNP
jgi:hypothetical protein